MQECVVCEQVITNPLCVDCLGEEIKSWLVEKGKSSSIIKRLDLFTQSLHSSEGVSCVHCKGKTRVCPSCYTKEVYELLKEELTREELEEYDLYFNFYHGRSPFSNMRRW